MQEVDYVDSTGLGAMVMCSTRIRNASGVAKLVNVNRRNIELMRDDEDRHAFSRSSTTRPMPINSFFPGREIKRFDILSFVQQMRDE